MAKKVRDPADPGPDVSLYLIYIGFAIVGIVWLALHLGNHMSVTKQDIPINPIAIVAGLARGKLEEPPAPPGKMEVGGRAIFGAGANPLPQNQSPPPPRRRPHRPRLTDSRLLRRGQSRPGHRAG